MRRARSDIVPEVSVPDAVTYIEIRQAILRRDFILEYLPKVGLRSGLIEGVEALVRWEHGTRGRLSPEKFLPETERTALMGRLTSLVLDQAISQCVAFHRKGVLLGMSVNVSASSLADATLADQVRESLERHDLNPWWLTLEISQSGDRAHLDKAVKLLEKIHASGVQLSLDDFGENSMSLSYLGTLSLNELKIDRSVISQASTSPANTDIVRSTVELARRLGMRVVAEGVEDATTLALVHALRVDAAQGYHLSPPLGADDLLARFHQISSKARELAFSPPIDLRDSSQTKKRAATQLKHPISETHKR